MKCKLCLEDRELCDSHIIPEFFYKASYDEKHRMAVLKEQDPKIHKRPKGEYEPLLCAHCEKFLNETYEAYFSDLWYGQRRLPCTFHGKEFIVTRVDYKRVKLLLLSILWRASISYRPAFSKMSLGVHEERIRVMVRNQDPGGIFSYQIFGSLLLFPNTKRVHKDLIVPPMIEDFEGHLVCMTVFGGCVWCCVIGDNSLTPSAGLLPSGELQFAVHDTFDVKPITSFLEGRLLFR